MRRLTGLILGAALWPAVLHATPVLDQEHWTSPSAAVAASFDNFRRAMSFTAGLDGLLVRVEVRTISTPTTGSTLALLPTTGGVPDSAPVAIGAYAGTVGDVSTYDFAGFAQSAGQVLAIELVDSGTSWLSTGDDYAGGEEFSWFPPAGQTGFTPSGLDLFFRSFVEATPAAIPAPAGVLALGLLALLALRHKTVTT
jgi:hypothetical protein